MARTAYHGGDSPEGLTGRGHSDNAERTCTIWYLKRELGRTDFGDARLCQYIQGLITGHGFPRPLPTFHKGELVGDVRTTSRWIRAAVDQWLDDFLPPDLSDAIEAKRRAAAAADMDSAAAGLRLIKGGRA